MYAVLIENEFTVASDPDVLWQNLLDVERVASCMPGAELTETVDDRTWKGKVKMKFGPVQMAFIGTVTMKERDDEARRVQLHAQGTEQAGKGAANAMVTSWLETGASSTTVKVRTDLTITGALVQMSRGLLPEVSRKLTQQFADCLMASMQTEPTQVDRPMVTDPRQTIAPIGGIRLGMSAVIALVVRFFRSLLGRSTRP